MREHVYSLILIVSTAGFLCMSKKSLIAVQNFILIIFRSCAISKNKFVYIIPHNCYLVYEVTRNHPVLIYVRGGTQGRKGILYKGIIGR